MDLFDRSMGNASYVPNIYQDSLGINTTGESSKKTGVLAGEDPLVNGIYAEDFIAQMQGQEQGGAAMNWGDPHAAPLKAGKN